MDNENRRRNVVVGVGIILAFFAIPHLIDDFLFNIPEEFGLTNQTAQLLAGLFTVILILFLVLAARDRKVGYVGMLVMGAFLALAGILKHIPLILIPGPYWSGRFSEILIFGLIASGIILAIVSSVAIRNSGTRDNEKS